ncbi:hypothetical protein C0992_005552 [Termitomyces sp. T32_za158]|nr:hypothetical protein C0992_005552 [Termitomyces sp. T32_za158]
MKSMVCDYPSVQREVRAYELLSKADASNVYGMRFIRKALDSFQVEIEGRNYPFLIHEPLGITVYSLAVTAYDGSLPILYVKGLARDMLHALDAIHSAGIVHGDLQTRNILLRIHDETLLEMSEEDEMKNPSRRKVSERTTVFEAKDYPGPLSRWVGTHSGPVLCDFGEARTGGKSYTGLIQPAPYRAPEVLLHLPWGTPVDIWNFGCMIWNSIFPTQLFSRTNNLDEQLARMAALLGPPPQQLLDDSGSRALEFFDEDGSPKGGVPHETLESSLASCLEKVGQTMTAKESEMFLAFIRRTVTWTQETRATASELLDDPCLE